MTTTLLPDDPTRWRDAACRDDPDPESWFPHPAADFTHARAVCADCPIRLQCAHFAVDTRQSGVWGGTEFDRGRPRR